MKVTANNVTVGDIVEHKELSSINTYRIIAKKSNEFLNTNNEKITKCELIAISVDNKKFKKENNFYCLPNGEFPMLSKAKAGS